MIKNTICLCCSIFVVVTSHQSQKMLSLAFEEPWYFIVSIVAVYILVEIFFYLYIKFYVLPSLQPVLKGHDPLFENSIELTRDIFRLVDKLECYSYEMLLSGFCLRCDVEEVYSENFESLLAWCCFVADWSEISKEQQDAIIEMRHLVWEKLREEGFDMKIGFNPRARHSKCNLEPIAIIHRPLALYWLVTGAEKIHNMLRLQRGGFRYHKMHRLSYWYKAAPEYSSEPPLVILHGICRGWSFYSAFVKAIGVNRAVILFDYDCIKLNSMEMHVPGAREVSSAFVEILDLHSLEKVSILGHSWGSLLAVWLVRLNPDRILHVTFVDPLCFTVALAETTYYLFYKPPKTCLDYLVCYFVRHDITLANALQRHFAWYNVVLKLDEIPAHIGVVVGIAGKDEFICVDALSEIVDLHVAQRKRESSNGVVNITKLMWDDVVHGGVFENQACINDLVNAVQRSECQPMDSDHDDNRMH